MRLHWASQEAWFKKDKGFYINKEVFALKKLELGNILIHDVQFSNEGSKVENGVLYVNK